MEQIESKTKAIVRHHLGFGFEGQERTLGNGQGRAPLVSKNVQTDATIRVDVRVIDTGREVDFWGLERVIGREMDVEEEDTARVWTIALRVC